MAQLIMVKLFEAVSEVCLVVVAVVVVVTGFLLLWRIRHDVRDD
jgi:hypothetical protein